MKLNTTTLRLSALTAFAAALLGTAGMTPARANNNDTMSHDDAWVSDSEILPDPAPTGYPFSAPAGLDIFHWTDYRKQELGFGSASERRAEVERHNRAAEASHPWLYEANRIKYGNHPGSWFDDDVTEPAPAGYPFAATASIDLYHWKDYSHRELEFGSLDERRDRNDEMRMARDDEGRPEGSMRMHRSYRSDGFKPMTESVQYPFAVPGGLDMMHWTDYTKMEIGFGSSSDTNREREEYNMRRDRMLREHPDQMDTSNDDMK